MDVVTRAYANYLNLELLPASAIVAAGGWALGALADLFSGDYSQEREVPFPDREGFYMVRCIAQPNPRGPQHSERRGASVKARIVEVRSPERVARSAIELPEAQIAELELQKALTSDPAQTQRLDAQIAAIRLQSSGNVVEYLTSLVQDKERELAATPPWQRDRVDRELSALRLRLRQAISHRAGTKSTHHRPRAAFTSLETGETYPLLLELSEIPVESGPGVRLMDLTRPDREPFEKGGSSLEAAVRNAFDDLALHDDLGRGTLVVRMPDSFPGQPRELSLSTGDADIATVRRRLQDLATLLLVLSVVVPGAGEVSAVLGAGLAAERLIRRAANDTLRLDTEAISDTIAILGAIAQGAQLIGGLRVRQAGRAFVAAARSSDQAAVEAAAAALDAAIRTGRILDATSAITNVGGVIWGDAVVATGRWAQLQQDELDGRITHAQARRQRAELLGSLIRDHSIMLGGVLRAERGATAGAPSAQEPATRPPAHAGEAAAGGHQAPGAGQPEAIPQRPAAVSGTAGAATPAAGTPRPAETLDESELERRSAESAGLPGAPATGERARPDNVRARFRTPDDLHDIFILRDGRIFRCSVSCAQLRTWYGGYLERATDPARAQQAADLNRELTSLENRSQAGDTSPALQELIARLDMRMRDFIAFDLVQELTTQAAARGLTDPEERLLSPEQVRSLLGALDLDEVTAIVGPDGFRTAAALRRLANSVELQRGFREVLRAYQGDPVALRSLAETLDRGSNLRPQVLISGYQRAVGLKTRYGARLTGDIVGRCVKAAEPSPETEAEIQAMKDVLEGRTPWGAGAERVHGLSASNVERRPEGAAWFGGVRGLFEVKTSQRLTPSNVKTNLGDALSQIRRQTAADDAPGLVRIDARASGLASAFDETRMIAAVYERMRWFHPNAAGVPEGDNVRFIELLYRDAAEQEQSLWLEVRYTPSEGTPRGAPVIIAVIRGGSPAAGSGAP